MRAFPRSRALFDRLGGADRIDWGRASLDSASVPAQRGRPLGSTPTDRGHPGAERHPMVDGRGTPRAILRSPADTHQAFFLLARPLICLRRLEGRL